MQPLLLQYLQIKFQKKVAEEKQSVADPVHTTKRQEQTYQGRKVIFLLHL